tara:strand:- start:13709 stop:14218 length:510 start_codon:yes stop_codon:yes gene_type:complete
VADQTQNSNRKKYDFSSVGQTIVSSKNSFIEDESALTPVGILTPLRLGNGSDGLFKMSKDIITQVRDNFRNMLATNWGDRLMLHDFGANLSELAFELGTEVADLEAVMRIKATTEKYMPFVTPITFESFNEPSPYAGGGLALIGVRVTYTIDRVGAEEYADEVVIYTAG